MTIEDDSSGFSRRAAGGLFLAFFVMSGCWALATPLYSAPDEPAHVIKAAGTVRGQLLGNDLPDSNVTAMRVPAWMGPGTEIPYCYRFDPAVDASCAPKLGSDLTEVDTPARAGKYPPFYYALVGWPTYLSSPTLLLLVMRLGSAVLGAAFLAAACITAVNGRSTKRLLVGIALAMTPMVFYLLGSVNPNGLEVAAAVCVWTIGVILAGEGLPSDRGRELRLLIWLGLSVSALALSRSASPMFVAVIAFVLLLYAERGVVRKLAQDRRVWILAGLLALVGGVAAFMVLQADPYPGPVETIDPRGFSDRLLRSLGQQDDYALQMVGVFGNLDTPAPVPVVVAWAAGAGALLVLALNSRSVRAIAALLLLCVAVILVSSITEAMALKTMGVFWQGRYSLPLAVGIPILASGRLSKRSALSPGARRRILVGSAVIWGLAQLICLIWVAHRFSVGVPAGWSFAWSNEGWRPLVPFPVTFACFAAAAAYAGYVLVTLFPTHE